MERIVERRKEPEPGELIYEQTYRWMYERCHQKQNGAIILKGKELAWEQSRQALLKFYLYPAVWDKVGVPGWFVFINHIKKHSGKHIHQGGLGLFVLEGRGYTVVNGVKYDWEKDDLILLPVMPGGCEHQHFNAEEGKPCFWLAFIFTPYFDAVGNALEQKEIAPEWKGSPDMPHVA